MYACYCINLFFLYITFLGMKYIKTLGLFEKVLEKRPSRLLGLDVGMKYVGLAVSDAENKVASPLRYVKHYLRKQFS